MSRGRDGSGPKCPVTENMREAFALQKLLIFFQQKILAYIRY